LVMANWFDPRIIMVGGLTTDAGTLIFPFTFILSDLITEVYGYKNARRAIWVGFGFNLLFMAYGQIVIHLPGPLYYHQNTVFDKLLQADTRIVIASLISYLTAEPLNALVMAKLKILQKGRFLPLRFVASTALAAACDSTVFALIAFYGVIPVNHLVAFIVTMWGFKVVIEIIGLPVSVWAVKRMKRIEQLDIYDIGTKFQLFSLKAEYKVAQNHYTKEKIDRRAA